MAKVSSKVSSILSEADFVEYINSKKRANSYSDNDYLIFSRHFSFISVEKIKDGNFHLIKAPLISILEMIHQELCNDGMSTTYDMIMKTEGELKLMTEKIPSSNRKVLSITIDNLRIQAAELFDILKISKEEGRRNYIIQEVLNILCDIHILIREIPYKPSSKHRMYIMEKEMPILFQKYQEVNAKTPNVEKVIYQEFEVIGGFLYKGNNTRFLTEVSENFMTIYLDEKHINKAYRFLEDKNLSFYLTYRTKLSLFEQGYYINILADQEYLNNQLTNELSDEFPTEIAKTELIAPYNSFFNHGIEIGGKEVFKHLYPILNLLSNLRVKETQPNTARMMAIQVFILDNLISNRKDIAKELIEHYIYRISDQSNSLSYSNKKIAFGMYRNKLESAFQQQYQQLEVVYSSRGELSRYLGDDDVKLIAQSITEIKKILDRQTLNKIAYMGIIHETYNTLLYTEEQRAFAFYFYFKFSVNG